MQLVQYAEDLAVLDARERFLYLIELGKTLPEYPKQYMIPEYEVPGCTSLVYVHPTGSVDNISFDVYAEAQVVKGYVRILLDALNTHSAQEILEDGSVEEFITEAQMNVSTQTSRANAFGNIYNFMKLQAKQFKEQ